MDNYLITTVLVPSAALVGWYMGRRHRVRQEHLRLIPGEQVTFWYEDRSKAAVMRVSNISMRRDGAVEMTLLDEGHLIEDRLIVPFFTRDRRLTDEPN